MQLLMPCLSHYEAGHCCFYAYLSHLSQFLDGPGIAQVLVESRGYAQDELWYEEYQHRRDRPYPLDQYSCHGQAYWLTPESNQSKHTIDTPLQMVGNHYEPVAELYGGVNRHDNKGKRCYYAQYERVGCDNEEQPRQGPDPRGADHELREAEMLLKWSH